MKAVIDQQVVAVKKFVYDERWSGEVLRGFYAEMRIMR